MRKMLAIFVAFASALCADAALDVITLGHGESFEVARPAKVAAIECFSDPTNGTYSLKRETVLFGERLDVVEHASTNFAYYVVTTNALGVTSTNVLSRPHPVPYPDTMTGYWTNETVTAWSTTNAVPIVSAAFTNDVGAATWLAPGDRLFTLDADTFRGRLNVYIEK
jgi:hypothetical protein